MWYGGVIGKEFGGGKAIGDGGSDKNGKIGVGGGDKNRFTSASDGEEKVVLVLVVKMVG